MVGRPLEDCLMIPSVVQLLWLMAFIFHECQTSANVRRRQNTFPQTQISLPVGGLNETSARADAVTRVHRLLFFFFLGIHLADEDIKKLRFKKENVSPRVAPHRLCLSSTPQSRRCARTLAPKVITGGTGPLLSSSAEENVMSAAV